MAGATSASVQVPITDDTTIEESEMFTTELSTNDPNVIFGDDSATVTILDNDSKS